MDADQLKTTFDGQAQTYDQQWHKLSAFRDALHLLVAARFQDLPADAHVLCVGAGTGAEMQHLAERFPRWRFTAVEPSGGMLEVCRSRAQAHGYAGRCSFHEGYLESLPAGEPFDAATCFLVSQFILSPQARSAFFRTIADRLAPGAPLASTDLSADVSSTAYDDLLAVWMRTMAGADVPPENLQRMRKAYSEDVAIVPPPTVASILSAGGFDRPVQFFQVGLIHGWFAQRRA